MQYIEEFYINTDIPRALELLDMSESELELITGRFRGTHYSRPGQLKGLLRIDYRGQITIVHHFTKKLIWRQ